MYARGPLPALFFTLKNRALTGSHLGLAPVIDSGRRTGMTSPMGMTAAAQTVYNGRRRRQWGG